jgi:tetratricopeptide (TPR) repeat protein
VGHAIKEIILGMKTETVQKMKEKDKPEGSFKEIREEESRIDLEKPDKPSKVTLLSTLAIVAILIVAGILLYPKVFKRDTLESLKEKGKISVAVMPFKNMTNDTTWIVWEDGIQENLIIYFSNFPDELKVLDPESVNTLIQSQGFTNHASITPFVAKTISQKLEANVFVYGSIQQAGTKLRLNAKLISTKTEEVLKSFEIDGLYNEEIIFDITDSLRKKITDFLLISKLKKDLTPETKTLTSTNYPEAYRYCIQGQRAFNKGDFATASNLVLHSIEIDSNFVTAILYLSIAYEKQGLIEQAKKWCIRAYEKSDLIPLRQKYYTNWLHARFFETPNDEIRYLRQLLEIDSQLPFAYYEIGNGYNDLYQYEKAIPEYEKALKIFDKWDSKPSWITNYINLGLSFHQTNRYKKEKLLYKKAEQDFPDNPSLIFRQAVLALSEEKTKDANEYIEKYKLIRKENSVPEASIMKSVADIYSDANILDKAEENYRQSFSLEPESSEIINILAYFLIDKDRNINEGLELISKALELSPENYYYLHTKGRGLYKQGKYQEALEILQKSWNIRSEKAVYDHEAFLHLEAAKKAVASQKNN